MLKSYQFLILHSKNGNPEMTLGFQKIQRILKLEFLTSVVLCFSSLCSPLFLKHCETLMQLCLAYFWCVVQMFVFLVFLFNWPDMTFDVRRPWLKLPLFLRHPIRIPARLVFVSSCFC